MADIVNLNKARKAAKRREAEAEAVANRVKHGRTGPEKLNDRQAEARRRALLEGALLESARREDSEK